MDLDQVQQRHNSEQSEVMFQISSALTPQLFKTFGLALLKPFGFA